MAFPLGIITGLLGSTISNLFSWLNRKENNKLEIARMEHDKAKWEVDLQKIKLGSQAKVSEIEMAAFAAQIKGSMEGLLASYADQTMATSRAYRWTASAMACVRPVLTFALLITVWVICVWAIRQLAIYGLEQDWQKEVIAVAVLSLSTILELTSMAVTWWFGDRSIKRGIQNTVNGGQIRAAGGDF